LSDSPYDGLCGIPCRAPIRGGTHLRCTYEPDHGGEHSWKRHEHHSRLVGGVFKNDMIRWFHPVPRGCTCRPCRAESGEIVEYVFSPDCLIHASKDNR